MKSVPFRLTEVYEGLAEGGGIVRLDGSTLFIEYQVKDGIFGLVKSGVKTVSLRLDEIAAVEFRRGKIRSHLVVRPRSIAPIADIPGQDKGEVKVRIARSDRDLAEQLAAEVTYLLSIQRLDDAFRGIEDARDSE